MKRPRVQVGERPSAYAPQTTNDLTKIPITQRLARLPNQIKLI